ncbi:hypothetical protein ACJJTC_018188 [Scirpophaga incertulas]
MSEHLQPSIMNVIPETDIDLIRKSLENDDPVDVDILSCPDEQAETENKNKKRTHINQNLSEKYFKGNLQGKISKIRIATFKKSTPNVMTVKYSMSNDAAEETIPIISKPKTLSPKYKSCLPITKTKYNNLMKLCDTNVIPRLFHAEYLNFPTCNGKDVFIVFIHYYNNYKEDDFRRRFDKK